LAKAAGQTWKMFDKLNQVQPAFFYAA